MQLIDDQWRFFYQISGYKEERFANLEKNCQSLDNFKRLNILCYIATYAHEQLTTF